MTGSLRLAAGSAGLHQALLGLLALAAALLGACGADERTVVVRGATVLDGSGEPSYVADVLIRGETIAEIAEPGELGDLPSARSIDGSGLYLAPGFIDPHSHTAEALTSADRSHARALLIQGVTTVVLNPDGDGPVDLAAQRDALRVHCLGVNVGQFIGHGSVRAEVLGMEDRLASAEELERMRELVREAMRAGALGLSSGPFYAPGSYSDTDELVELAKVVGESGGVYSSHIRDESNYGVGLLAAVDEVITVAEDGGVRGIVTHVKALGPPVWGLSQHVVKRIEAARERGVEVYADQYPYVASATGLAAALLPRWAEEGGRAALLERLSSEDELEQIREAMIENLERRGGAERIQFRFARSDPSIEGRTLAAVARERDLDPVDLALELLRTDSPGIVSFNMSDEDVERFMRQPWTMTSSDGGYPPWGEGVPHPRAFGTYPRKIREYVVERQTIDLATAIRSMTSLPADVLGLGDRGRIAPGQVADLVLFDLERMRDRATFDEPYQESEGVVAVWIAGRLVVEDGRPLGELAGRVLRRSES